MSVEATREVMMRLWETNDPSTFAEDVLYILMGTGQEIRGPKAV